MIAAPRRCAGCRDFFEGAQRSLRKPKNKACTRNLALVAWALAAAGVMTWLALAWPADDRPRVPQMFHVGVPFYCETPCDSETCSDKTRHLVCGARNRECCSGHEPVIQLPTLPSTVDASPPPPPPPPPPPKYWRWYWPPILLGSFYFSVFYFGLRECQRRRDSDEPDQAAGDGESGDGANGGGGPLSGPPGSPPSRSAWVPPPTRCAPPTSPDAAAPKNRTFAKIARTFSWGRRKRSSPSRKRGKVRTLVSCGPLELDWREKAAPGEDLPQRAPPPTPPTPYRSPVTGPTPSRPPAAHPGAAASSPPNPGRPSLFSPPTYTGPPPPAAGSTAAKSPHVPPARPTNPLAGRPSCYSGHAASPPPRPLGAGVGARSPGFTPPIHAGRPPAAGPTVGRSPPWQRSPPRASPATGRPHPCAASPPSVPGRSPGRSPGPSGRMTPNGRSIPPGAAAQRPRALPPPPGPVARAKSDRLDRLFKWMI